MSKPELQLIDVDAVLRNRLKGKYKYIPQFVVRRLQKTICQDRLNSILVKMDQREGYQAADAALEDMRITITADGLQRIPTNGRRLLLVSNHPLGGLDGLGLISLLGHHFGGRIRFLVNDLLMAVTPLRDVFLPINKYGKQARAAAEEIEQELAGDKQIITFPAGLCSRRGDDGIVRDLEWKKSFVNQAVNYHRDIVPMYFDAKNSDFFYRTARRREKLGIKFNFEMIYLPKEMFKQEGSTFRVIVGEPIAWQDLNAAQPAAEAVRIKEIVYNLKK